jgi:hypothetical protein
VVGGFPSAAVGIAVHKGVEFGLQFGGGAVCYLLHPGPIDPAGFVERNGQRFGRGLDMLDRTVALQSAAFKDRGFGRAFGFGVVGFEREQQRMVRVAEEGPEIIAPGERSVSADEGIVDGVEAPASIEDVVFGCVFELGIEDLAGGVAHGEHAADADAGGGGEVEGFESVAGADDDDAVALMRRLSRRRGRVEWAG